jgi:hypothetical protein
MAPSAERRVARFDRREIQAGHDPGHRTGKMRGRDLQRRTACNHVELIRRIQLESRVRVAAGAPTKGPLGRRRRECERSHPLIYTESCLHVKLFSATLSRNGASGKPGGSMGPRLQELARESHSVAVLMRPECSHAVSHAVIGGANRTGSLLPTRRS